MFEAFRPQASDVARKKTLAASTIAAIAAYSGIAVAAATFASGAATVKETILDVTFEKQLPKKEMEPPPPPPPPPPPQKKIEKPKIAPPPTPVPEAPPPPPTPTTFVPKVVPKEILPESDQAVEKREFIAPSEGIGGGSRRAGAAQGGVPGGTGTAAVAAPAPTATGPVNLPEDAEPAVPSPDNKAPEYPEAARATGKEGKVILKVVITADGRVGNIQVMKGEPPFLEAATAAVKLWRFTPAMLAGKPISVYRIIAIPFRLSVGGGG